MLKTALVSSMQLVSFRLTNRGKRWVRQFDAFAQAGLESFLLELSTTTGNF